MPVTGNREQQKGGTISQPIKVSDALYARLKERAQAERLTLQEALVEIVAAPHEGLIRFESELAYVRNKMASGDRSRGTLEDQMRKLQSRLDQLVQARAKDIEVFNSWVETWQSVPVLIDDFVKLEEKVANLRRLSHRHTWQVVEGD